MTHFRANKLLNIKGVSMLELLIAVIILVVGLIPMLTLFITTRKGLENREEIMTASILAQNLMDTIRSKKWDPNSPIPPAYITNRTAIPATCGSVFDDINSFNQCNDKPDPNFTRHVDVKYVDVDQTSLAISNAAGLTDFKEVGITVSWLKSGTTMQHVINTVLSNGN